MSLTVMREYWDKRYKAIAIIDFVSRRTNVKEKNKEKLR